MLRTFGDKKLGELAVWQFNAEFVYDTGLVLYRAPRAKDFKVLDGLGFTAGNLVTMNRSGSWLLIRSPTLKAHPRLYELSTGALIFTSDTDSAVEFRKAVER